jgi:hypothetical protein
MPEREKNPIEMSKSGRYAIWRITVGTVSSSLNPGVADLLQTLSSLGNTTLNSSSVVNAIKSAPTSDIVALSDEAMQLQNVDTLFGIGSTPTTDMSTLLAELGDPSAPTTSTTSASTSTANETPAQQAQAAQATAQAELTQGLFGVGASTNLSGTIFSSFL